MKFLLSMISLVSFCGCSTLSFKDAGKSLTIAAAYEQSDEKQQGMTQRDYETMIRTKSSQSRQR
ncbi:hypothetical protein EGM51_12680 [Verrucomicrobia bacterium S94]|nr:hypothetical protein EGM51_12680 [Verrucomicrobia bacterium S94]